MEFNYKVQFLGVEEMNFDDGKLYLVRSFVGNEIFEFYVNGRNDDSYAFANALFGDEFTCVFAVVPHPKYKGAFKLKFKRLA